MRTKNKFLNGERYGKLVVTSTPPIKKGTKYYYECKCDCGNTCTVREDSLMRKQTQSCGCLAQTDEKIKKLVDGSKKLHKNGTQPDKIGKITKANKSGVVGVNWDKSRCKWQASIRYQGTKINIGRFKEIEDAIEARKKVEEEIKNQIKNSLPPDYGR